MSELNETQKNELRQLIVEAKEQLVQQLSDNEAASQPVQLDQTVFGRVSRMDAIQQQHMAASTREQAQRRLLRLNKSIQLLDNGDYGYCQHCDEPINYQRLLAQPEAVLCLQCQEKRDSANT